MGRKQVPSDGELELVVVAGTELSVHPLPPVGRLTIGRGADCDIRIDDGSVSRRHAELDLGPPLRVVDLESANGTLVRRGPEAADRAETSEARPSSGSAFEIGPGDRIHFGTVMAVVRRRATPSSAGEDRAQRREAGAPVIQDPAMQRLYEAADRAAQGTISVLLLGETGVGKEVLAREIHRRSPRATGPFVVIDCAGLAGSVLEGELFGHEKGAFTGASESRPGLFELADGGTAFLDEIGELPALLQVKLLRVLEDRTVTRVGGRTPKRVDVRFIAATNRDLAAEVERGLFRRDLFYRVGGMTLEIPPLRERSGDIPELAARFVAEACRRMDRPAPAISEEALRVLSLHAFPGNVRELRHAMEHAVLMCGGGAIEPAHLPRSVNAGSAAPRPSQPADPGGGAAEAARAATSLTSAAPAEAATGSSINAGRDSAVAGPSIEEIRAALDALERQRVVEALERCGGNQTRAAEMLGISRRTLVTRLGDYGLPRPRKRGAEE